MADVFIDVGVETDESTLADGAITRLRLQWPDWDPDEGDLEVIQIETLAAMAADAAQTAAKVPSAVFRTILGKLHGVEYDLGAPATATATFTLLDTDPHVIPEGTEIDVDGYAFTVDADTETSALTEAGVPITAATVGLEANDLTGDAVQLITSLSFVVGVALDVTTANGVDPEDDQGYEDRGSRELQLQAKTIVTTRDYELMALSQSYVGRVLAISDPVLRQVRVIASTPAGGNLSPTQKTNLALLFGDYRLSNWTVTVEDATTTTIAITYTVHPYPGQDPVDLKARVDAALTTWLTPGSWGQPKEYGDATSTRWYLEARVRKNKAIDLIGDVPGVDYVVDLTIAGSAGSAQVNGDWLMPGTVPLATVGVLTGTVS